MSTRQAANHHSVLSIIALSAPALPMSALMMPLVIFIPPFFAEHMGMGMAVVGGIFTLGRLFDVITDPVVGSIMDKSRARISKRVWVALGAVPIVFSTIQIFVNPPDASSNLLFWVLVLYAGWTLMNLGLYSWGAEVAEEYHQRSRVMGAIQIANNIGSVGVLLVPAAIEVLGVGGDVTRVRIQAMGIFILGMMPLTLLIAWFLAPVAKYEQEAPAAILPALRTAFKSKATRLLLGADLAVGIKIGLFTSLTVFLLEIVLNLQASAGTLQLAMLGAGLLGIPPFVYFARKLEKHRAMALTTVFTGGGGLAVLFVPADEFAVALALYVFYGIGTGASQMFPRAIMADVVDEHQAASGDKNTGVFFSFLTTTLKLGLALGVGVGFGLAELSGFDPATARTDDSAHFVIRAIIGFGELILGATIVLLMWTFPLDRKRQELLRQQITGNG